MNFMNMIGNTKKMGSFLGGGITVLGGFNDYKQNRADGEDVVSSVAKAATSTFLWSEFMLPMMALQIAPMVPQINAALHKAVGQQQKNLMPMGQGFQDSEYAQTSRARALEAIQASRLNARQFIGSEAQNFATRYR